MSQLIWKAILSGKLSTASINYDKTTGNTILAFYSKNQEPILPKWKVMCDGKTITRSFNSFWGIVRDTLYEYQPAISISSVDNIDSSSYIGVLTGFIMNNSDTFVREKHKQGKYYLHLSIKLNKGLRLPKRLNNVVIKIKGKQLPKEKYSYQYCDKFSAKNLPCSFNQYLKVGGTWVGDKGVRKENCRVFRLEKGNPHQYCSFLLGT